MSRCEYHPGSPRAFRRTTTMMSIRAVKATTAKSTPNQMGPRIKNTIAPDDAGNQPEARQYQPQGQGALSRRRAADPSQ